MKSIKEKIYRFLEIDKFVYDEIFVSKNTAYKIMQFAKNSCPREFIAFLKGKIINRRLIINDLIYQHFQSDFHSAIVQNRLQSSLDVYGSIHSHPGYFNSPSFKDLEFFSKNGTLHLIICKPFNMNNIKAYNSIGGEMSFKIY